MIIAVDGYSSCGKSTFAKAIAQRLNLLYIDSGAMYRAITLVCLNHNCIKDNKVDLNILKSFIDKTKIEFIKNASTDENETYLNGNNVEKEIRDIAVSNKVSLVSTIFEVREKMVQLQREMSKNKGVVMDGRDIGTTVFPNADIKIFMTADVKIRAQRRYKELIEKGISVSFEEVIKNIEERDYIDQNRKISPLRKADDAIILDNSNMTPEEQMVWFNQFIASFK
ncbi:MAG: (d)CMP kinase [Bacteroidales bacterium]|nr:(d)CMP kinase [Bacteroidales bacterium]